MTTENKKITQAHKLPLNGIILKTTRNNHITETGLTGMKSKLKLLK